VQWRFARFGSAVSNELVEATNQPESVTNAPALVLCLLDLDGPTRPMAIAGVVGRTSGGTTKLLDRMEVADEAVPELRPARRNRPTVDEPERRCGCGQGRRDSSVVHRGVLRAQSLGEGRDDVQGDVGFLAQQRPHVP
jgi:hypothetical protein